MAGVPDGRVEGERDLFEALVGLASAADLVAGLGEALRSLAGLTGAERAFLELYDGEPCAAQRFAVSHGCTGEQEAEIRAVTSRGIVAAAIAAGKTLHTPFALLDERFAAQDSVRRQQLEAVLCLPLTAPRPGVLYLEGKRGQGPFTPEDVALAEKVARFLGPLLDRAAALPSQGGPADLTRPFRARLRLDGIAGRSPALAAVFEQVSLIAPLDITVLITGESGTGKTQVARAIHDNSPRRGRPFVELNCAAIPDTLIEAELFGTREGAFTGAKRLPGKVELADGGTLFLDEVVEIPVASQGKLLQLLQARQYYPLGSTALATANIRIIAATNSNPEELVAQKKLREDLYYRLATFHFRMPALAERREDIGPLLDELAARIAFEHGLKRLPIALSARTACEAVGWPGNVRQLRSRLEAATIRAVAEGAAQLEARHLGLSGSEAPAAPSFHEATRLFQKDLLARELKATGWDTAEVARRLDLTRSHIYNLIKAFDLQRDG